MASAIFKIEDKSDASRYGLAILVAIAALVLRQLLSPLLGEHSPFVTVWAAVIFAVWCCGTGPAVVTALIGLFGVWYWFFPPYHSFSLHDPRADISTMVGFIVLSALIIALGDGDHRSQRQLRQEIAERLRTDKNLRESEERLRIAQKAGHSGSWELNFETQQLIASPELQELYGFLPGTAAMDRNRWMSVVHPNDVPAMDKTLSDVIQNRSSEYHAEFRVNLPNGSFRWIESLAQVFYDDHGKALRIVGVSTDITERKKTEERERRMREEAVAATAKFRAVFEQTPVFAGVITAEGVIVDANRLFLEACGYRSEDVLDRLFWETGWWRNSPEAQAKIRQAIAQAAAGTPYRETLTYHWADGTERLVDFALHPIRDHEDKILFLHPTGIDITDLKSVELELRKSHDELEARVESRTRELAASLASLESEIVLRKATEKALRELSARTLRLQDEERRRFARDLHDSTGQTLVALKMTLASLTPLVLSVPKAPNLINDLEALAEQALQEIRTTSHLLHPPLLDEVGFSSAAQWYVDGFAKRSGVKTNLQLSVRPSLTKDEELVFFRILQESLTNVLRHSGSTAVDIQLESDHEDAILSIRDYGKGIPAKTLSSFRETAAGVGVGLGGMKQRVRELGGHLRVDSDENGTCVIATLPLTKSGRATEQRSLAELPGIHAD